MCTDDEQPEQTERTNSNGNDSNEASAPAPATPAGARNDEDSTQASPSAPTPRAPRKRAAAPAARKKALPAKRGSISSRISSSEPEQAKKRPAKTGTKKPVTRKRTPSPDESKAERELSMERINQDMVDAEAKTVEKDPVVLSRLLDWCINRDPQPIREYVDRMRKRYPRLSRAAFARKVVSRRALKTGVVGALTSVGGWPAMPLTVPTDVIVTWRIQVFTVMCVAYIYEHLQDKEQLRTDIYLILAGDAAKEALKRLGIEVTKNVTRDSVRRYVTRQAMQRINRAVSRRILEKSSIKTFRTLVRAVPLLGAAVGFLFDWSAAQTFGHQAIQYYSSENEA